MSKVRVTFTEKIFIDDHTITYHGVMIPLYGLLDYFIDIYYLQVVQPDVKLYYELKFKNGLSIDQKLRLIAETDRGRLIIKEFSEFGTNASMAEVKRRFVPDWYIHPNGPVSSLTTGNHSYSEYYYLPLDDQEKWKRYVGTLPPSVPLFVSLFKDTTNVLTRIISRSPSRSPSRSRSPSVDRDGSGAGMASTAAIVGGFVRDAGEITSPLRTEADNISLAFDQISLEEIIELQTEKPIAKKEITVEEAQKEPLPTEPTEALAGDTKNLEPPPYAKTPENIPKQEDLDPIFKDIDPNSESEKDLPNYEESVGPEIVEQLPAPYNIKKFVENILKINYEMTKADMHSLSVSESLQKYLPKGFTQSLDITAYRNDIVKAYIQFVSNIPYRYSSYSVLISVYKIMEGILNSAHNRKDIPKYKKEFVDSLEYLLPKNFEKYLTSVEQEEARRQAKEDLSAREQELAEIKSGRKAQAKALKLLDDVLLGAEQIGSTLNLRGETPDFTKLPPLNNAHNMATVLQILAHSRNGEIVKVMKHYNISLAGAGNRADYAAKLKIYMTSLNIEFSTEIINNFTLGPGKGITYFT